MAEPEAAVAIVHACAPEEAVLLMHRAERDDDPWSGHWSLPGGRRDAKDPDLVHTALRELEEECGIRLGRDVLEATLPPLAARRTMYSQVLVAPFVFRIDRQLPAVVDLLEAVEAQWLPLRMVRDPSRHRLQRVPGRPHTALFPAIALNGTPLWGFTYRLIAEWLALGTSAGSVDRAGFEVANRVLEFIVQECGLRLSHSWTGAAGAAKIAAISGTIPIDSVLAKFSVPGSDIPGINLLEVSSDRVRIIGLAFEEYVIEAAG